MCFSRSLYLFKMMSAFRWWGTVWCSERFLHVFAALFLRWLARFHWISKTPIWTNFPQVDFEASLFFGRSHSVLNTDVKLTWKLMPRLKFRWSDTLSQYQKRNKLMTRRAQALDSFYLYISTGKKGMHWRCLSHPALTGWYHLCQQAGWKRHPSVVRGELLQWNLSGPLFLFLCIRCQPLRKDSEVPHSRRLIGSYWYTACIPSHGQRGKKGCRI